MQSRFKSKDVRKYDEPQQNNIVQETQELNQRKPYKRKKLPKSNKKTTRTKDHEQESTEHIQASTHLHPSQPGLQ